MFNVHDPELNKLFASKKFKLAVLASNYIQFTLLYKWTCLFICECDECQSDPGIICDH